ncbi:hypothetical protein CDG81_22635 [Actinopolyspora erythraea]|uniref:Uncharacterized protein n=1 Tax=Actinopolyspora erythraea TaxID=414996 RepID=A0A099DAB2_9ACTN|nr:hypothetical protein [Actinopolyspora erythraea]ASU80603.1 hypothetical protein CDG81_22635 [Actinopolyspora erythraea]KGI82717.1 hypothetical protein IL38_02195 [Actinopolyspora erythraea]
MRDVETVRELIGHADPAPPPTGSEVSRPSASDLIARAEMREHSGDDAPLPGAPTSPRGKRNRLAVVAATLLGATLLGSAPLLSGTIAVSEQSPPEAGPVRHATELDTDVSGRAAVEELLGRAERLRAAPYEAAEGEFGHIRTHEWSGALCSAGSEHCVNYARRREVWLTAPAQGTARTVPRPPEFGSAGDRDFWKRQSGWSGHRDTREVSVSPNGLHLARCVPERPERVAECLDVGEHGSRDVLRGVVSLFRHELLPRDVRAELLRVLARTPGVHFRGESEVRGHPVFAVGLTSSASVGEVSEVLLFDSATGVLRSFEKVNLERGELTGYVVFETYGRTNTRD